MSDRTPSICRTWGLAAALCVATSGAASVARTQQVTGSIGVSLTVVQPIVGQPVRVTGLRVDRDGVAHFETTVATSAGTSQLVMRHVSSSTTGFAPEPQPPTLIAPSSSASRLRYLVHVGRAPRDTCARTIDLRVEYLTVAGT